MTIFINMTFIVSELEERLRRRVFLGRSEQRIRRAN